MVYTKYFRVERVNKVTELLRIREQIALHMIYVAHLTHEDCIETTSTMLAQCCGNYLYSYTTFIFGTSICMPLIMSNGYVTGRHNVTNHHIVSLYAYPIHKTFVQHLYNVEPTSSTLVQHCINVMQMFCA